MKRRKLLVFAKNPELAKVKTRLAADIGNERALEVYEQLLAITFKVVLNTNALSEIWLSESVSSTSPLFPESLTMKLQNGIDLGERMSGAFKTSFDSGDDRVIIIGSDCPSLRSDIIEEAFQSLTESDLVIGPSEDGGYYLLGMRTYYPELFENIKWSSPLVLHQTMEQARFLNLKVYQLETLNDIDDIEDLRASKMIEFNA